MDWTDAVMILAAVIELIESSEWDERTLEVDGMRVTLRRPSTFDGSYTLSAHITSGDWAYELKLRKKAW